MAARQDKTVEVIGVPMDLGANIRGSNMGPAAVRIAELHAKIKLIGYGVNDDGDLDVPVRETLGPAMAHHKYLPVIAALCRKLAERCQRALDAGRLPLTIGGDHSLAIGSITGVADWHAQRGERIGLIWIDAHADLNTPETSPSGNVHGMPLSVILGQGHPDLVGLSGRPARVDAANVALIGIRAIDDEERRRCRESGVRYFTMREIDERGMPSVIQEAIKVATHHTAGIHLSFDLDGVDPLFAPGVSTAVSGGLSHREAHLLLETIADTGKLCSMDFVELNPMADEDHKSAHLVVELIQSALGKAIV